MSYLDARVLDRGLESLVVESTRITINPSQPIDYVTAYDEALGHYVAGGITRSDVNKPLVTGPYAAGTGRRVNVSGVPEGQVLADGVATHWCLLDDSNARLLATAPLAAALSVAAGNDFTLTPFDIIMPGAA